MTILHFSNQYIRLSDNYRFGNFEKRSEEKSKRTQADTRCIFLFLAACIFWDSKDKGRILVQKRSEWEPKGQSLISSPREKSPNFPPWPLEIIREFENKEKYSKKKKEVISPYQPGAF
jgi:hypothetical protein